MPFAYFFTESEGFAGSKKVATMSVAMGTFNQKLNCTHHLVCVCVNGRVSWHVCMRPWCCCCYSLCSSWASCGWRRLCCMTTLPGRVSTVSKTPLIFLREAFFFDDGLARCVVNFRPVGVLPSISLLWHLSVWSPAASVYVDLNLNTHRVHFRHLSANIWVFSQCALHLGCPGCSAWLGACWSNHGCVNPAFALTSSFCGCESNPHADICFHVQLLEDVEDTLSCTMFEEDYLSRKLNCEYFTTIAFQLCVDIFSLRLNDFAWFCAIAASSTSCWVNLNKEAMQKEYQAVHNKRISLGKAGWRSSTCCVSVKAHTFMLLFCPLPHRNA